MSTSTATASATVASESATRRALTFRSLQEILDDAESCVSSNAHASGGWTVAQNIDHVRRLMTFSREGGDITVPLPLRLLGRFVLKRSVLNKGIKPGVTIPSAAADYFVPPADVSIDEAMSLLRSDVERCSRPGAMGQRSPIFGPLSHDDWERLHCRHAELHFSFLILSDD